MKYELTGETRNYEYVRTLHRIRALRDIPRHGVKAGDLGGWVAPGSTLSQSGDAWIDSDAWIGGNARISGNAWIGGNARISGNVQISGNARIFGNAWVYDNARVGGDALIYGDTLIYGNSRVGDARIYGNARVDGDAWIGGDARIDNNACFLTATIFTSQDLYATAFRQEDGSWHVRVGCWSGSIPELRALAESDRWVDTPPNEVDEARPELLAFVALCEARATRTVL